MFGTRFVTSLHIARNRSAPLPSLLPADAFLCCAVQSRGVCSEFLTHRTCACVSGFEGNTCQTNTDVQRASQRHCSATSLPSSPNANCGRCGVVRAVPFSLCPVLGMRLCAVHERVRQSSPPPPPPPPLSALSLRFGCVLRHSIAYLNCAVARVWMEWRAGRARAWRATAAICVKSTSTNALLRRARTAARAPHRPSTASAVHVRRVTAAALVKSTSTSAVRSRARTAARAPPRRRMHSCVRARRAGRVRRAVSTSTSALPRRASTVAAVPLPHSMASPVRAPPVTAVTYAKSTSTSVHRSRVPMAARAAHRH
jgi:hypothetical protein